MFDSFITASFPLLSNLRRLWPYFLYIYRHSGIICPIGEIAGFHVSPQASFLLKQFDYFFLVFLYSSSILITQKKPILCISIYYSITFWYSSIALYSSFSTPLPLAWQKLRLHCPIPIITSPSLNLLFFSMTLFYYELNKKQQEFPEMCRIGVWIDPLVSTR